MSPGADAPRWRAQGGPPPSRGMQATMIGTRVTLRLRMSAHDAHYAGELVDGARMLALFGDLATELLIRLDGDEGLFRAYESVEFLAPVFAGDYIEATAELVAIGNTSRKMRFEARKVIANVARSGPGGERRRSPRRSRRRGARRGDVRDPEGAPAKAARALHARPAAGPRSRGGAHRDAGGWRRRHPHRGDRRGRAHARADAVPAHLGRRRSPTRPRDAARLAPRSFTCTFVTPTAPTRSRALDSPR